MRRPDMMPAFHGLDEIHRKLLALISLHGNFVYEQALLDAIRDCQAFSPNQREVVPTKRVREWLADLREANLLPPNGYRPIAALVHPVCGWAGESRAIEELADVVIRHSRIDQYGFAHSGAGIVASRVRVAFYRGDEDSLKALEREYKETTRSNLESILSTVPATWLRGPVFQRFSLRPRQQMALTATAIRFVRFDDCGEFLDIVIDLHREIGENNSLFIGFARIIQGHTDQARSWLIDDNDPNVLAARSCAAMADGNLAEARELYNQAWEKLASGTRKRNFFFPSQAGLLATISLFANPDPAELTELADRLQRGSKEKDGYHDEWLFSRLISVCNVLTGRRKHQRSTRYLSKRPAANLNELMRMFAEYWLRDKALDSASDDIISIARTNAETLEAAGYHWLSKQCAILANRIGDRRSTNPVRHLADFARPPSNWQTALAALEAIAAKEVSAQHESQERLIWRISEEDDYLDVVPVVQKRGKTKWTKGREISLDTLHKNQARYDFLTDHDRRVLAAVEGGRTYYAYLEPEDTLALLIDHPLVFHEFDSTAPVQIKARNVALKITRADGELALKLDPPIESGSSTKVIKRSSLQWDVIQVDSALADVARLIGTHGVIVPASAEDRVKKTIGALASRFDIRGDVANLDTLIPTIKPVGCLFMQITPDGEELQYRLLAYPLGLNGPSATPGSGAVAMIAEVEPGKPLQTSRDLEREKELAASIQALPEMVEMQIALRTWRSADPKQHLEALAALKTLGEDIVELTWPQGKAINVTPRIPSQSLNLRVNAAKQWFEANGELKVSKKKVLDLRLVLAMLDNAEGRFLKLEDGQYLALSRQLWGQLRTLRAHSQTRGKKTRIHPLSVARLQIMADEIRLDADDSWRKQSERIQKAESEAATVPSTLTARLRAYQTDGFHWLARLANWGAGACLADDMGLGKTVQALAALLLRAAEGPALVIAPKSVCTNWIEESFRFAPTLRPVHYGGAQRDELIADLGPFDVLVVSYGLLQHDGERLAGRAWHTLIFDEAQAIKNPRTRRAKAAAALEAEFRVVLTGTPVENHLGDLWSLFEIINPGLLGGWQHFRRQFAAPIERGDIQARDDLRRLIAPFVLRRLKTDVLKELPPRTEVVRHVSMSSEETALYESVRARALERLKNREAGDAHFQMLAELTRLRQACCHPDLIDPTLHIPSSKLQSCLEIIDELRENRHKALIFSQFTSHLALLKVALDERYIPYQYLDGSTSAAKRKKAVDAFQAGQGDLFLISLKAGGTGLNLTAADFVIHMDPWWNPAVEDQASDRAHRIGQTRPVTIYRLVAQGTIEDKIMALHDRKRDLAESLLSGSDQGLKLSAEDVLELLRED